MKVPPRQIVLTSDQCREIVQCLDTLRIEVKARLAVMAGAFELAAREPNRLNAECRANLMALPGEVFARHERAMRLIEGILRSADSRYASSPRKPKKASVTLKCRAH